MDIKVLGPGCPKCHQAERIVRETVEAAGADATVTKITDIREIAAFGVYRTPAVVVDGEVKLVGKVPTKTDILGWLSS